MKGDKDLAHSTTAGDDPAPERAFTFECKLGGDTRRDLVALLRHMAWQIEVDQMSRGCTGGPSSGGVYELRVNPEMTHEAYFAASDAWLERRATSRRQEQSDA